MKIMKGLLAVALFSLSLGATATTGPTAYDKQQDTKNQASFNQVNADIHTTYMLANTKYTESAGKFLEGRVNDLVVDQARQDKATSANLQAQQTRDAGQDAVIQQAHEKADAGAVRMDGIEKQAGVLSDQVGRVEVRADNLEEGVRNVQTSAQIANEKADAGAVRADGIEQRATVTDNRSINNAVRLDGVETTNSKQDTKIAAEVQDRVNGDQLNASQIAVANQNIETGRQAQAATNSRVASNTATLANHEGRISALETEGNQKFRNMDRRIDDLKDRVDAGLSGVAAMANIPQVTEYQTFAVGAGVGTRSNESAVAVGFSARAAQNVVVKASVATDTQQTFTLGGGVSVGW